jgi:predicted dehydrogenase
VTKKKYILGVIGCGKIWEIGHWPGLKELADEVAIRYVYDTTPALAAKAAADTGAKALDKDDAIFDDPAVDIVCVLTPPRPRPLYVRKACAAGKHLMIEKPMARTVADALDIVRHVRTGQRKCFVPFVRGLSALHRSVADAVRAGRFGAPLAFVHTSLGPPYPWIPLDHWMHDQAESGGPIFDFSIHFIEIARAYLGEAAAVLYAGAALTGRVRSDDQATLIAYYADGGLGQFTKSWSFPPGVDGTPMTTCLLCRDAVIVFGEKTEIRTPKGVSDFQVPAGVPGGRAATYRNLFAAIETNAPLFADELCGLRMTEILDAMEQSRASGKKEPVPLHHV